MCQIVECGTLCVELSVKQRDGGLGCTAIRRRRGMIGGQRKIALGVRRRDRRAGLGLWPLSGFDAVERGQSGGAA